MPTEAVNYRCATIRPVLMNIFQKSVPLAVFLAGLGALSCLASPSIDGAGSRTPTSHYERPANAKGPFKNAVIVFVHGMFGDAADTWTSANGTYWPRLILTDTSFDNFDVYVASYMTSISG